MIAGDIMNSRNLTDLAEIGILAVAFSSWHSPTLVREIDIRVR
jgi:hypothetical protein